MQIAWATVGDIIQRVVGRHQRGGLLDGLTHIGVDELSYRRHHEYVTVVVDHTTQRIVWVKEGKNADTLKPSSPSSAPSVWPSSRWSPSTCRPRTSRR